MTAYLPIVRDANGNFMELPAGAQLPVQQGIQIEAPSTPSAGLVKVFGLADLVPTLTSNTSVAGYTASASSEYTGPGAPYAWNAFKYNIYGTVGWLTNATQSGWIRMQFPSGVVAKLYEVEGWSYDSGNTRYPNNWTFEGSNDGTNWTTLDTQTSQAITFGLWQPNIYPIMSNTTSYLYYQLNVSTNNGNAYLGIQALRIMGVGTPGNGAAGNKKPARLYSIDETGNVNGLFGYNRYNL